MGRSRADRDCREAGAKLAGSLVTCGGPGRVASHSIREAMPAVLTRGALCCRRAQRPGPQHHEGHAAGGRGALLPQVGPTTGPLVWAAWRGVASLCAV